GAAARRQGAAPGSTSKSGAGASAASGASAARGKRSAAGKERSAGKEREHLVSAARRRVEAQPRPERARPSRGVEEQRLPRRVAFDGTRAMAFGAAQALERVRRQRQPGI